MKIMLVLVMSWLLLLLLLLLALASVIPSAVKEECCPGRVVQTAPWNSPDDLFVFFSKSFRKLVLRLINC